MRNVPLRTPLAILVLLCAWMPDVAGQMPGQAGATPRDVRLTLALDGDRQVFRVGEPIPATLTFEGAEVVLTDAFVASDEWRLTPSAPVAFWRDRLVEVFGDDDVTTRAVTRGDPTPLPFTLGSRVRFDRPGVYTLAITSSRATGSRVTSNTVSFRILPMSEADTASEIARIAAEIEALPDRGDAAALAALIERLAALEGDAATREHVRRLLARPVDARNGPLHDALFRSRDPSLAIALLEQAIRDVTRVPSASVLGTLVTLRVWHTGTGAALEPDPDTFMLRGQVDLTRQYADEIIASLPQRSNDNLRDTALMLLDLGWAIDVPAAVTSFILGQLDAFDPDVREDLLVRHWQRLGGAGLAHELTAILDRRTTGGADLMLPLSHLIDVSPALARPYVLREIADVDSTVPEWVLIRLPDATLPELDHLLLTMIESRPEEHESGAPASRAAALLSRYGSAAQFSRALAAYDRRADRWPDHVRVGLLAYLARWNEPAALPRLDAAIRSGGNADQDVLADLANLYYSAAIEALLIARLDEGDASRAQHSAFLIGMHGTAAAADALRRRLARWHAERLEAARGGMAPSELETRFDPGLQAALVEALAALRGR
jgi:hypothetical protein